MSAITISAEAGTHANYGLFTSTIGMDSISSSNKSPDQTPYTFKSLLNATFLESMCCKPYSYKTWLDTSLMLPVQASPPFHNSKIYFRAEHWNTPYATSALQRRGWAFQEAHLSRRRRLYTDRGLAWHCGRLGKACVETNPEQIHYGGDMTLSKRKDPLYHILPEDHVSLSSTDLPTSSFNGAMDWWYIQVSNYSSSLLTELSDRLPAIGGLASEFSLRTRYYYIAGIWQQDFLRGLLWRNSSDFVN